MSQNELENAFYLTEDRRKTPKEYFQLIYREICKRMGGGGQAYVMWDVLQEILFGMLMKNVCG